MRITAKLLLPSFAGLCIAISAQQADQKPSPAAQPAAAPKKAAALKKAAPSKRPPAIFLKSATSDGVVTGHTSDPDNMVRITVSKEGGEVKTEPAWSEPSGDFTIPLLLLKPGWIVQAWVVNGSTDLAHSAPIAVTAVPGDEPQTPAAAAPPVVTSLNPKAPAAAAGPKSPKVVAPAPADPCDDGNPDADATLSLTDGDSALKGRTFKFLSASGKVTVCVNGKQRQIRDTTDTTSVDGSLKKSQFDVTLTSDPKLAEGNYVLVAIVTDSGERATIKTTVAASKTITASPCDTSPDGDLKIFPESVSSGVSEITATLPASSGTVNVCVNDTQVDIAGGPGPASAATTYAKDLKITTPKLDLLLKDAVKQDQLVRIVLSIDKTTRVSKDITVAGAKFSRVLLPSAPKEGETKILVDTKAPPAAGTGTDASKSSLSLSVFINQDRVPLLDSKGSEVGSLPVDASGETGLTLKNPVDGGDCVVVIEHEGTQLPSDIDFNQLVCDSKNKVPKSPDPSLYYSYSYPLLASSLFNWGRVRGYMVAGGLFSFDNNNFSQESIFLGFNLTKNWRWAGPLSTTDPKQPWRYQRLMFETFFDVRLTSVPVAACTTASSSTTTTPAPTPTPSTPTTTTQSAAAPTPTCPNTVDTFVSTRKSAVLNGGVSLPYIVSTWHYAHRPYGITFGPIAKVGFDTPVSDVQSGTVQATPHEFFTNFGFGTRLGLYRMSYSTSVAPELESYVDIVTGRYSNFDITPPVGSRYARPWRIGLEGVLKVPTTPFIIGFGANIHQNFGLFNSKTVDNAKDSLQFLFGAKFDAGKLFNKIGSIK